MTTQLTTGAPYTDDMDDKLVRASEDFDRERMQLIAAAKERLKR